MSTILENNEKPDFFEEYQRLQLRFELEFGKDRYIEYFQKYIGVNEKTKDDFEKNYIIVANKAEKEYYKLLNELDDEIKNELNNTKIFNNDIVLNFKKKYFKENYENNLKDLEDEIDKDWKADPKIYFKKIKEYRTKCGDQQIANILKGEFKDINKDDVKRYVYEIIQNADDCEYENPNPNLTLKLWDNKVSAEYNEIGFKYYDIYAITGYKESSKNLGRNKQPTIGEKGIGFKSIFSEFKTVKIKSNGYNFYLDYDEDIRFPKYIENTNNDGTCIELIPYPIDNDNKDVSQGKIYNQDTYYKELKEKYGITQDSNENKNKNLFKSNPIMFTNKLKNIKIEKISESTETEIESFEISRGKIEEIEIQEQKNYASVTSSMSLRDESIKLFGVKRKITFNEEQVKSRYGKEEYYDESKYTYDIYILAPKIDDILKKGIDEGNIYSFLPTFTNINAPIIIHAPFELTQNRSCIYAGEENGMWEKGKEWNDHIFKEIFAFDEADCNTSLLNCFYNEVKKECKTNNEICLYLPNLSNADDINIKLFKEQDNNYAKPVNLLNNYLNDTLNKFFEELKILKPLNCEEDNYISIKNGVLLDKFILKNTSFIDNEDKDNYIKFAEEIWLKNENESSKKIISWLFKDERSSNDYSNKILDNFAKYYKVETYYEPKELNTKEIIAGINSVTNKAYAEARVLGHLQSFFDVYNIKNYIFKLEIFPIISSKKTIEHKNIDGCKLRFILNNNTNIESTNNIAVLNSEKLYGLSEYLENNEKSDVANSFKIIKEQNIKESIIKEIINYQKTVNYKEEKNFTIEEILYYSTEKSIENITADDIKPIIEAIDTNENENNFWTKIFENGNSEKVKFFKNISFDTQKMENNDNNYKYDVSIIALYAKVNDKIKINDISHLKEEILITTLNSRFPNINVELDNEKININKLIECEYDKTNFIDAIRLSNREEINIYNIEIEIYIVDWFKGIDEDKSFLLLKNKQKYQIFLDGENKEDSKKYALQAINKNTIEFLELQNKFNEYSKNIDKPKDIKEGQEIIENIQKYYCYNSQRIDKSIFENRGNELYYELLQNVDDRINEEGNLIIEHDDDNRIKSYKYSESDGGFSICDVIGITSAGLSGNRMNQYGNERTGFMGTGFTGIYNNYDRVIIESGFFNFVMDKNDKVFELQLVSKENYNYNMGKEPSLPIPKNYEGNESKETRFKFEIDNDKKGIQINIDKENFDIEPYLFLRRIKKINDIDISKIREEFSCLAQLDLKLDCEKQGFNKSPNIQIRFENKVELIEEKNKTLQNLFSDGIKYKIEQKGRLYITLPLDIELNIPCFINMPDAKPDDSRKGFSKKDEYLKYNNSILDKVFNNGQDSAFIVIFNEFFKGKQTLEAYKYIPIKETEINLVDSDKKITIGENIKQYLKYIRCWNGTTYSLEKEAEAIILPLYIYDWIMINNGEDEFKKIYNHISKSNPSVKIMFYTESKSIKYVYDISNKKSDEYKEIFNEYLNDKYKDNGIGENVKIINYFKRWKENYNNFIEDKNLIKCYLGFNYPFSNMYYSFTPLDKIDEVLKDKLFNKVFGEFFKNLGIKMDEDLCNELGIRTKLFFYFNVNQNVQQYELVDNDKLIIQLNFENIGILTDKFFAEIKETEFVDPDFKSRESYEYLKKIKLKNAFNSEENSYEELKDYYYFTCGNIQCGQIKDNMQLFCKKQNNILYEYHTINDTNVFEKDLKDIEDDKIDKILDFFDIISLDDYSSYLENIKKKISNEKYMKLLLKICKKINEEIEIEFNCNWQIGYEVQHKINTMVLDKKLIISNSNRKINLDKAIPNELDRLSNSITSDDLEKYFEFKSKKIDTFKFKDVYNNLFEDKDDNKRYFTVEGLNEMDQGGYFIINNTVNNEEYFEFIFLPPVEISFRKFLKECFEINIEEKKSITLLENILNRRPDKLPLEETEKIIKSIEITESYDKKELLMYDYHINYNGEDKYIRGYKDICPLCSAKVYSGKTGMRIKKAKVFINKDSKIYSYVSIICCKNCSDLFTYSENTILLNEDGKEFEANDKLKNYFFNSKKISLKLRFEINTNAGFKIIERNLKPTLVNIKLMIDELEK